MQVAKAIQPITTYEDQKAKVLDLGTNLEADAKPKNNHNHLGRKSDAKSNGKAQSNKPKGEGHKDKVQVPKSEKDRRMKDGECVKCGKGGHFGKDCRTGWKYNAASTSAHAESKAVTTIEKKRPASTQSTEENQQKRSKLVDQPHGSIKTIAPRIEELTDSGND